MRLTGNGLCEKCLTCSWRAYEKRALRKCGTDIGIFLRVMKEINDLL